VALCAPTFFLAAPASAAPGPTAGAGVPHAPATEIVDQPLMRAARPGARTASSCAPTCSSTNWAGYAQVATTPGTFTGVTDTFVVPTVSPEAGTQYVADWVGIGGFVENTLVQDGIQVVQKGKHSVTYDAWTEILPAAEKPLALTIEAGNTVTATVQETAVDTWLMQVTDVTTGLSAQRSVTYVSSGESAEAILERPCIKAPCGKPRNLAHLAQTSDVTFAPGSYSLTPPGETPVEQPLLSEPLENTDGLTLSMINMFDNRGVQIIASPSAPSAAADGFTVADGSNEPPPPTI
jgi:hypothetical protein